MENESFSKMGIYPLLFEWKLVSGKKVFTNLTACLINNHGLFFTAAHGYADLLMKRHNDLILYNDYKKKKQAIEKDTSKKSIYTRNTKYMKAKQQN